MQQLQQALREESADTYFQRGRQKTETLQANRSLFVKETVSTQIHRHMSKGCETNTNIVDSILA